ncbi:MAG: hypothetical protein JRE63_08655 [Deltaproteobacteria bacterium]|jgi:hypothetical protein|nr:hypothetical protein [Deltaproteobacteria bacterium]MBW2518906.1 hypothetical protein [Deltaproteobacteria bacterium]
MIFECLHEFHVVEEKIKSGRTLLIAGDEKLVDRLPRGRWIGGTTPYFMTPLGGICTDKRLFVTDITDIAKNITIKKYDHNTIENVYIDAPANGFSFLIFPEESKCHFRFAMDAFSFPDFAMHPLVGWVSGTHLDERKLRKPKVYDGSIDEHIEEGAIVMHVDMAKNHFVEIGILNMFEQGSGDSIVFPESGYCVESALINGKEMHYADYIRDNQIDLRLPLVTDINGTLINTSFRRHFDEDDNVLFHSPIFKGLTYRHAKSIENYSERFAKKMSMGLVDVKTIFSCNCILNFIYSGLDKYSCSDLCGPATFGEIAYHIHNQTVVYLRIIKGGQTI